MKYHVEKSTHIKKDVRTVRAHVENFRKWNTWSPWTIAEPECKLSFGGTPNTPGHTMSWDGEIIGSGVNTLKETTPESLIYDLEFIKPFKSKAKTSFKFTEENGGTKVTWIMDSSMPFFLFFMVPMMKNWIGMDYDRGLRMLKEITEKGVIDAKTSNNGMVDYNGYSYVGIRRTTSIEKMPEAMKADFERIVQDVVIEKKRGAKQWISIYEKFDMKNMVATYVAAISDEDLQSDDVGTDYVRGSVQDTKALEIKHDGSYEFLGNAWSMGMMYMRAKKIKGGQPPFEQYWNSPLETAPRDLKTSIFFPIKG